MAINILVIYSGYFGLGVAEGRKLYKAVEFISTSAVLLFARSKKPRISVVAPTNAGRSSSSCEVVEMRTKENFTFWLVVRVGVVCLPA